MTKNMLRCSMSRKSLTTCEPLSGAHMGALYLND
jgi:hypothetical protein